ncbi:DNA-binding transcriptional regulator, LysR family [Mesorhizobium albiziae]|uniref:DNA-binding transcriptional regulator, LysR family n=1 Tax=Neomesorhizobium albiziae TaxID=335020 RepID=A0A1I3Z876_9HYPH|nr:LysR substrate-binding domain-containing protein [Mesorhizobium albiziae]SFK40294.1 DNA-binding transcriptional regulator, LysR family [Mesorhizobium albiziae]
MELRHLRYFVAVAEELSFTAAAGRLGISQPPLSQQIKDLEDELGTALFERTSRRVELTAAGAGLLEQARAILIQAEQAALQTRAIGSGQVGLINIGTTGSVLLGSLAELIAAFGERHPGVVVRIHEMGPLEQQTALLNHRIDISFIRRPRHEPNLITELAWHENVGVVLPEAHPLARYRQLPLSALKDQNLVFLRLSDSRFARYLQDCCIEAGFMPRISHEVVESYSLTSLVAAGLGVALVPESVKRLSRPGVLYRPLKSPTPIADVEMMYRPDRSEVVERLVRLARNVLNPVA